MSEASISVRGLGLDVPMYLQGENKHAPSWGRLLLGAALNPSRRRITTLLDDISFELREGDRLAILGRNGAGKSTLLRILNGVYRPTRGSLDIHGSCQALLNLSLGFNNEATLSENIILRGVAMGLKSSFLKQHAEDILHFAGLESKAHHFLRTVSTGQRLRLGFAISTAMQNDIMLMDEWVGAGDAEFMSKAKARMRDRVSGSKIVVLASHSDGLLRDICNKGIVLDQGRLLHFGDIASAQEVYHGLVSGLKQDAAREEPPSELEVASDAAARIQGGVDQVIVGTDVVCTLEGWWVGAEGELPQVLAIEVNGRRYLAGRILPLERMDVMQHFHLPHDGYGFRARIRIPHHVPGTPIGEVKVFAGYDRDSADVPLPLPAGLAEMLDKGMEMTPAQATRVAQRAR